MKYLSLILILLALCSCKKPQKMVNANEIEVIESIPQEPVDIIDNTESDSDVEETEVETQKSEKQFDPSKIKISDDGTSTLDAEPAKDITLISNPQTKKLIEKAKEKIKEHKLEQEKMNEVENELEHEKINEKANTISNESSEQTKEAVEIKDEKIIVPNKQVQIKKIEKPTVSKVEVFDHSLFNALLSKHVTPNGIVDYSGLKKNVGKLDSYINQLDQNPIQSTWSKNKQLAYWINVYNAFTIKMILKNFPLKRITDLENGKPWDLKWIKLGGKVYSLNQIENDIIRPDFKDPRIHFAVNCAAKSCPPILNKAYTEDNLNSELDRQTTKFINNSNFNQLDESKASISKIFEWYKEDFGELIIFINKYAKNKLVSDAAIGYNEYDWDLNGM